MTQNSRSIYLIRHGETAWSLSGQHTGLTDIPLTDQGMAQATLLRNRLEKHHFTAVFSSPLKRALQTCQLAGLAEHAIITPLLVEWDYGDYEGLTTSTIHEKNPGWNIFTKGSPNGESPASVQVRAQAFLTSLESISGEVIVFSHGHFLRALTAVWLNLPLKKGSLFSLSPASISCLGFERKKPVILSWNETHFRH